MLQGQDDDSYRNTFKFIMLGICWPTLRRMHETWKCSWVLRSVTPKEQTLSGLFSSHFFGACPLCVCLNREVLDFHLYPTALDFLLCYLSWLQIAMQGSHQALNGTTQDFYALRHSIHVDPLEERQWTQQGLRHQHLTVARWVLTRKLHTTLHTK